MNFKTISLLGLGCLLYLGLAQMANAYGIANRGGFIVPDAAEPVPMPPPYVNPSLYKIQTANVIIFFGTAYLLGLLVRHRNWKVGYTRKSLAAVLYLAPFQIGAWWQVTYSIYSLTLSSVVFALCLAIMSQPFRDRIPFLSTAFACIDRPEDRPLTLTWLLTSVGALWLVLLIWTLALPGTLPFIILALFISGVADAVAEPVGLAFGRHPYATRALWTDKTYIRTLEGSASVYLTTLLGVFYVDYVTQGFGGQNQFLLVLLLCPVIATLVEAKSPHTWDQPFLIASTGLTAAFIQYVS